MLEVVVAVVIVAPLATVVVVVGELGLLPQVVVGRDSLRHLHLQGLLHILQLPDHPLLAEWYNHHLGDCTTSQHIPHTGPSLQEIIPTVEAHHQGQVVAVIEDLRRMTGEGLHHMTDGTLHHMIADLRCQ